MIAWSRHAIRRRGGSILLGAVLMGVALMAPSAWAEPGALAVIETRAFLEEDSDAGINAALKNALDRAMRGAAAMGLSRVEVSGAYRGPDFVVIRILATTPTEDAARSDRPRIGEARPGR